MFHFSGGVLEFVFVAIEEMLLIMVNYSLRS